LAGVVAHIKREERKLRAGFGLETAVTRQPGTPWCKYEVHINIKMYVKEMGLEGVY
jgi:hypothetical protein